jgi:hypothetical protein
MKEFHQTSGSCSTACGILDQVKNSSQSFVTPDMNGDVARVVDFSFIILFGLSAENFFYLCISWNCEAK